MFEIGIFCVIVLAVSYWAVLWVMGRREDVLHGEFVNAETQPGEPVRAVVPKPSVRPIFPERRSFPERHSLRERPALADRPVPAERIALPERPVQAAVPEQPAFRPERLEQLLASIKQDLNQLVQK
jgi:hypothetical protein